MKSPSAALVWEICRKYRWGFVLLVLLFAACAAWSEVTVHLQKRVKAFSIQFLTSGYLSAERVLPLSPTGLVERVVRFKLNSKVIYEGPFSPRDGIAWRNDEHSLFVTRPWKDLSPRSTTSVTSKNLLASEQLSNSLQQVQRESAQADQSDPSRQTQGKRYAMQYGLSGPRVIELAFPPNPSFGGQGDRLSWSVGDGEGKGSVFVGPRWEDRERITWAIYDAEECRQAGLLSSVVLMGFSVLVLFVIFGGTEPQEVRGFTGLPPRRFTLPVRTSTLVAWPLLLGSISILVLVFAWSRLVFPHLLPQGTQLPETYVTLLLLAGLSAFQAIVWGLPSFPKTRAVLLTVLMGALLGLGIYRSSNPLDSWSTVETVFGGFWLWGTVAAWIGVRHERHGTWAGWQRRSALSDLLRRIAPRSRAFRSALHAQVWLEWRRNCRVPLLVWTPLLWFILGAVFLQSATPTAFSTALYLSLISLAWLLAITGLNLARDGTSKKLLLSSFTATRPVSTGSLATAKLLAGLKTWVLAILIFGSSLLVAASASCALNLTWDRGGVLPDEALQGTFICLCLISVSLHILVGILPLCLSGKIPGFPWTLLPLLLLIGGVVNTWRWLDRPAESQVLLCTLLSAFVVLKLVVAMWGFRRAIGCRLVSRVFLAACVTLWLIMTGVCLVAAISVVSFVPNPQGTGIVIALLLAALLAVPLTRIALSPLALALNRHR